MDDNDLKTRRDAAAANVAWPDRAHAAVTDAYMTAAVVNVIADYYRLLTAGAVD